jgi:hypothetical protein
VFVVEKAIRGMLPKNTIGRQMLSKLQVYEGAEHPHQAQMPQPLKLGEIPKWEGLPKPKPKPKPKAEKAPEPKAPARKRATAKPAVAAKRTAAKRTTAKRTTAKATEPKAEAKPRARRAKKEE